MADSTKALLDQGVDIVELLAARAHERGMQFWPALRMNDIHEDDTERFGAFRSTFKKEHQELLIGSPYPTVAGYGYDAGRLHLGVSTSRGRRCASASSA